MKLDLAFYTYFYGSSENLAFNNIPQIPSLKYKCYYYTNNKTVFNNLKDTNWIAIFDDKPTTDDLVESAMVSKFIKAMPQEYPNLNQYDYLCHLDNKLDKISEEFIESYINTYFIEQNYALVIGEHPFIRTSVMIEFDVALNQERYRRQRDKIDKYITDQVNNGLSLITNDHYTTNILLRNMKHERMIELNTIWYQHIQECGIECQISMFFVKQLFSECIHMFSGSPYSVN